LSFFLGGLYFGQSKIRAAYLARVLVIMWVGGESNRSLAKIRLIRREDYLALRRTNVGGLGGLAWKILSKLGQFF
jgi:glycosyltransferase